jgi:hypothetical protein
MFQLIASAPLFLAVFGSTLFLMMFACAGCNCKKKKKAVASKKVGFFFKFNVKFQTPLISLIQPRQSAQQMATAPQPVQLQLMSQQPMMMTPPGQAGQQQTAATDQSATNASATQTNRQSNPQQEGAQAKQTFVMTQPGMAPIQVDGQLILYYLTPTGLIPVQIDPSMFSAPAQSVFQVRILSSSSSFHS